MLYQRDGKYYLRCDDGEEVEALPPEEQEFMARDLHGYYEWKMKQLKEKGYTLGEGKEEEPEEEDNSEDLSPEEYKRRVEEIGKELDKLWDETYERWAREDAEDESAQ